MTFNRGDKVLILESKKFIYGTVVKQVMSYHGISYYSGEESYFVSLNEKKLPRVYTKKQLELWSKQWNRNIKIDKIL